MKKHIIILCMLALSLFANETVSQVSSNPQISTDSLLSIIKGLEKVIQSRSGSIGGDTLRIELIEKDSSSDDFFMLEWSDDTTDEKEPNQPPFSKRSYGSNPGERFSHRITSLKKPKKSLKRSSSRSPKFGLGYKISLVQTSQTAAMPGMQWSFDFLLKEKNDLQLFFALANIFEEDYYYDPYQGSVYKDTYSSYLEWRLSYLRLLGSKTFKLGLGGEAGAGVGFDDDYTVAVLGPKVSFQKRWKRFVFAIEDGINFIPDFTHKVGARVSIMLF